MVSRVALRTASLFASVTTGRSCTLSIERSFLAVSFAKTNRREPAGPSRWKTPEMEELFRTRGRCRRATHSEIGAAGGFKFLLKNRHGQN